MTEQEKKAIKKVEEFNKNNRFRNCGILNNAIDTLLNLIQKKQKEIEKLTKQSKNLDKEAQSYLEELAGDSGRKERIIKQLQKEVEKKDKIIDLMAEYFVGYEMNDKITFLDKKQVKQYFEKKVEDKI